MEDAVGKLRIPSARLESCKNIMEKIILMLSNSPAYDNLRLEIFAVNLHGPLLAKNRAFNSNVPTKFDSGKLASANVPTKVSKEILRIKISSEFR